MALRALQDLLWELEARDQPALRDRWQTQMMNRLQELWTFVNL